MKAALERLLRGLGPEAGLHVVGGAVRDRLLNRRGERALPDHHLGVKGGTQGELQRAGGPHFHGREMGDVDLATPMLPEALMARARKTGLRTIPTGLQHGTITVLVDHIPFEITTFRGDGDYLDGRRPTSVRLGVGLEEDLARRDFTVNALAVPLEAWLTPDWRSALVDPFDGQGDLVARCIRAVGDPLLRFQEDGLRPYRACRFASQLAFSIEPATLAAIPERLEVAGRVAVERVLVELTKLLCGRAPGDGLRALEATGLLDGCLPEMRPTVGCTQNEHHAWPVWEHTLAVVESVPPEEDLRWAALLHDVGKPEARTIGEDGRVHFYQHERRSEELTLAMLHRLRASKAQQAAVLALVRHHGRVPEPQWSDAACRRFLSRLAEDGLTLQRWGTFREGDIAGKGRELEASLEAHRSAMTRLHSLAEARPALDVKSLALDGRSLMALLQRPPGPWVGALQRHLLEAVLEDPEKNTREALETAAREWNSGV